MKNRDPGRGIADEKPTPAKGFMADLVLPVGAKVKAVEVITPEITEGVDVKYTVRDGRLRFELPGFLVYSIARVKLQKE